MLIFIYLMPFAACKRLTGKAEDRPDMYHLSEKEMNMLIALHNIILPDGGDGPNAIEINSCHHFEFILADKKLNRQKRKILLGGFHWLEDTSQEMYGKNFVDLGSTEKEQTLHELELYKNGERWLSFHTDYILEALLGAPAYSINTNGLGWNWLGHVPGVPQPEKNQIYGNYGYGL